MQVISHIIKMLRRERIFSVFEEMRFIRSLFLQIIVIKINNNQLIILIVIKKIVECIKTKK